MSITPTNSLDTLFGKEITKGRDSKADLLMLKNELGAYSIDTLANLSETEGSAIREFANTLEKEMTSPEKCLELYEAVSTVNANWAGLTNTVDLSPVEKEKITSCTRAIILTQMRSKGMNLTVNPATNAVEVANEPTTWKYPSGKTETQFLTDIGLNTPAAAKKALDESEHFMRAAATMATRTATGRPGSINITTTSATAETSTGPDVVSQTLRKIPYGIGGAIDDTRIDHPGLFWGVPVALGLFGLYRFFGREKKEKAPKAAKVANNQNSNSNNTPSSQTNTERGIFKTALRNLRIGAAEKTMMAGLLALLGFGGFMAYKYDAGGLKSKVNGFGGKVSGFIQETIGMNKVTGAIDGVKQEIEDIKKHIPGMPARPSTPPSGPPSGPAPAPAPAPSGPEIPPTLLGEQAEARKKTLTEIKPLISSLAVLKRSNILNPLKTNKDNGSQEALKQLRALTIKKNPSDPGDISRDDYKKAEEILSRGVSLEKSIKEATEKSISEIKITIPGSTSEIVFNPSTLVGIQKLTDELTPTKIGIDANTEWGDGRDAKLKNKLQDLQTKFKAACIIDLLVTPHAEDPNKRLILEPLWRKMVYDICMERVDAIKAISHDPSKDKRENFIKDITEKLDKYLGGGTEKLFTTTNPAVSASDIGSDAPAKNQAIYNSLTTDDQLQTFIFLK